MTVVAVAVIRGAGISDIKHTNPILKLDSVITFK